jgi:hypothetical protein
MQFKLEDQLDGLTVVNVILEAFDGSASIQVKKRRTTIGYC